MLSVLHELVYLILITEVLRGKETFQSGSQVCSPSHILLTCSGPSGEGGWCEGGLAWLGNGISGLEPGLEHEP